MTDSSPPPSPWFVDAHAHLHERYDLDLALDAAKSNAGSRRESVLLLADVSGQSTFEMLAERPPKRWHVEPLEGGISCRANDGADGLVFLVAGRQLVTRENLELLALGSPDDLEPGLEIEIEDLIEHVNRRAALAVLPWGFGKWTGRRGRIVEELLEESSPDRLFFGDNGGRPSRERPRLLRLAQERGFRVLPGSDPLPLSHQERRVGSYGFETSAGEQDRPWESLKRAMTRSDFTPRPSGSRVTWRAFSLQQTSMLVRKHVFGRLHRP